MSDSSKNPNRSAPSSYIAPRIVYTIDSRGFENLTLSYRLSYRGRSLADFHPNKLPSAFSNLAKQAG